MMSNNILAFFTVGLLGFILQKFIHRYAYQSHYSGYAFLVQCFENTTIVAYAGLRVKWMYFCSLLSILILILRLYNLLSTVMIWQ